MMTTGRTTYRKTTKTTGTGNARRSGELLIVTKNDPGTFARVTDPLTRNNIHVECFTTYAWGDEVAFRFVTDNNRKATEILKNAGLDVNESPVALWYTDNGTDALGKATNALARACIDTYCSYMTTIPNTRNTIVAFNTNDTTKTINILNEIR